MGAPRSPQGNGANGLQCDNFVALCGVSLWRSKTKNFLSISFSASRRRGGGRRREKNARKFFGFCTRESASVSEADCIASQRNRSVRRGLEPPRAPRVRLVVKILRILSEIHSNFVQYTPQNMELYAWPPPLAGSRRKREKRVYRKVSQVQILYSPQKFEIKIWGDCGFGASRRKVEIFQYFPSVFEIKIQSLLGDLEVRTNLF